MLRRIGSLILLAALLLGVVACSNKHVQNPIANLGSKQPDKVLFDRAMESMKRNRFDTARMLLQTLINAYPDSEFIARAKLATGDSWYAQGGSTALAQAENEYKDFITFFPNMPEAAEAQMKIANIHYRQMEKPDRDFTHAKRAEEEYRTMILQYPDSKLVPEAMQHLREVQEVLGEREFLIGRFYYLRESWAAAMARLQSLVDTYPLYSDADEALYMLGQSYERQYDAIRNSKNVNAAVKERLAKEFADRAGEAYARIVTRYPVMARAEDARRRLAALGQAIPKPTEAAIAQNKAEVQSRRETGTIGRLMSTFHRGPDMAQTATVGEPTLAEPKQTGAPDIVKQTANDVMKAAAGVQEATAAPGGPANGTKQVGVEVVKEGAPPPNQPVPRSIPDKPADTGIPELPVATPDTPAQPTSPTPPDTNAPAKPTAPAPQTTTSPAAPPPQVNEAAPDPTAAPPATAQAPVDKNAKDGKKDDKKKDDKKKDESSSKKKKKKLGIF